MSGAIPGIPAYISVDNRTLNLERILEGIVAQSLIDVILRTCRCGLVIFQAVVLLKEKNNSMFK
jgi:hypothetical protein